MSKSGPDIAQIVSITNLPPDVIDKIVRNECNNDPRQVERAIDNFLEGHGPFKQQDDFVEVNKKKVKKVRSCRRRTCRNAFGA